ncbi:MAG: M20/M25/M40 family metallo-hydrolase [Ruminococcaceae bacterium]|nr:M20/M25/M40 family metallo-hydrolase [Oscillospiraceae bacterium]
MLYILLGVLVIVLGAACVNAARIKVTPGAAPALHPTPEGEAVCAEKLSAMVRIPTVSKNEDEDLTEFYRLHAELERLFPLIHQTLEKHDLRGSLVYHWKGADPEKKPIVLMGHQDVVPASDDGWRVPAYSGEVIDGELYGRGAMDCKSTMLVELQAVEELLAEGFTPPCDLYLAFGINEETSGDGAPGIVRWMKERGIAPAIVLDEGGVIIDEAIGGITRPYAVIGIMEKGYMDVKITARGKGGHSSTPPRNTPAARLFAFANEIERKRPFRRHMLPETEAMFRAMAPSLGFPLRLMLGNLWLFKPLVQRVMPMVSPFGEALLATTCCFTMMKGSDAANVIPKEPYLIANLRPSVHQGMEASLAVLRRYAKKYDLEIEVIKGRDASPVSSIHSAEYAYLTSQVAACFPDVGIAPYTIMGGTDCRTFCELTENALRFAPIRATNAQNNACHAVDERITVSALAEGVLFWKKFIREYPL